LLGLLICKRLAGNGTFGAFSSLEVSKLAEEELEVVLVLALEAWVSFVGCLEDSWFTPAPAATLPRRPAVVALAEFPPRAEFTLSVWRAELPPRAEFTLGAARAEFTGLGAWLVEALLASSAEG